VSFGPDIAPIGYIPPPGAGCLRWYWDGIGMVLGWYWDGIGTENLDEAKDG
jgi:hypothetical protein